MNRNTRKLLDKHARIASVTSMGSRGNEKASGKAVILGSLLATLLVVLLSTAPAGAALPSGKALGWGDNFFGELGNGTDGNETDTPGAVRDLSGVKSVKAGCDHALALLNDGTVHAMGYNKYGQLGNGTNTNSKVPVTVEIEDVKAISAGCRHSLALKEDGSVWAWGDNEHGQLGNGTSGTGTEKNLPVRVTGLGTSATGIAGGYEFSLALLKNGTVRSWGSNIDGELGNGTSGPGTDKSSPVPVKNLSGVKALATDSYASHSLALLVSGTVKAWGLNYSGQLGNGSPLPGADRGTPVMVKNLFNVRTVATGGFHSLALLEGGRVKSWGSNRYGQLGINSSGTATNRSNPGFVIGLTNVRSISGGAHHSLAVLQSGAARSWGYNSAGQLGDGNAGVDQDVPVAVKNVSNLRNTDGGYAFSLAVTE